MSHPEKKQVIDCLGYRYSMDKMVDLILTNGEERDHVIAEFIELQQSQDALWREFVAKNYPHNGSS